MQKYQVYCRNRRAKAKPLKRQAFDTTAADALDNATTNELSSKRPMSRVLNIIDQTTASEGEQERAKRRTQWLLKVQEGATSVKLEPGAEGGDGNAEEGRADDVSMPFDTVSLAACVQAGVEAGMKQHGATTLFPSFGPGMRKRHKRHHGASALNAEASQVAEDTPPAPPKSQTSVQTSTSKATASKVLSSQAKGRSAVAHKEQRATPPAAEAPSTGAADKSADNKSHKRDVPAAKTTAKTTATVTVAGDAAGDSSDAAGDSSDEEGAHRPTPVPLPKPPPPPPDKTVKQAKIAPRIALTTVDKSHALFVQEAVAPALTPDNAAGRFVLAPPSLWPAHATESTGGFVGKVMKCLKTGEQATSIRFKDGRFDFAFASVLQGFKPLS